MFQRQCQCLFSRLSAALLVSKRADGFIFVFISSLPRHRKRNVNAVPSAARGVFVLFSRVDGSISTLVRLTVESQLAVGSHDHQRGQGTESFAVRSERLSFARLLPAVFVPVLRVARPASAWRPLLAENEGTAARTGVSVAIGAGNPAVERCVGVREAAGCVFEGEGGSKHGGVLDEAG